MLGFVSEFTLPGGEQIRRYTYDELEGWVVETGPTQWLYADGTVGTRPRWRACDARGLRSEDDLQGAPDEEWAAVAAFEDQYAAEMVMSLADAWQAARAYGLCSRYARLDDRVGNRYDERIGTVINPGTDHDRGRYVRVRFDDGDERTYPLSSLVFLDDER